MDGAKARADATRVRPMVTIKHDFAAAMEITQKETLCAQHALTHHLYVASVSWNPRRVPIPNSVRQARTKRTVRSRLSLATPSWPFFTPSTIKRECVRGWAGACVCVCVRVAVALLVVALRRFHRLCRCR
jgi:hypothetical protein